MQQPTPSTFTELLPGLYRWQGAVNSYLWQQQDGCVLIDPAADLTPNILAKASLGPVHEILITHVQEEHVAGCAHFPGIAVHVPVVGPAVTVQSSPDP